MGKSIIKEKSIAFAFKASKLNRFLQKQKEFDLSRQFIRSARSISANIEEALAHYSKKDFLFKMNIAYKEARETKYWLKIINNDYKISKEWFFKITEIIKILATIVIKQKKKLGILDK